MQIGQAHLSSLEKPRWWRLCLLMYCGLSGHPLATCPNRPDFLFRETKVSTQFILPFKRRLLTEHNSQVWNEKKLPWKLSLTLGHREPYWCKISGRVRNFYYSFYSICSCFSTRWLPIQLRIHQPLYFTYKDPIGSHSCWELHFSDQSTCCMISLVGNTHCNLLERRINSEVGPHMPSFSCSGEYIAEPGHLRRWTWATPPHTSWICWLAEVFDHVCATQLPPNRIWLCHWSPMRCHASQVQNLPFITTRDLGYGTFHQWSLEVWFPHLLHQPGFFFVEKKDGGLQPCIDYRGLIKSTVNYPFPPPLVPTALEQLCEASFFTKLDLSNAYN